MADDDKKLSEENFIHEGYRENPYPLWLWLALLAILVCLIWGFSSFFQNIMVSDIKSKPFLEVTNREMSLFLWQNPSFMRSRSKIKSGYLTGFKIMEKETMELNTTEDFVIAPPELLFLYHTWKRLVGSDYISDPIPYEEFKDFLETVPEWQPQNWANAPKGYVDFINSLSTTTIKDLQAIPEASLPIIVRQAFQGWKNYFMEGELINQLKPTYAQLQSFLVDHPFYARNYWRNIHALAGEHVLETLTFGQFNPTDLVPAEQIPIFLKVAIFNSLSNTSPTTPTALTAPTIPTPQTDPTPQSISSD